MNNKIDFLFDLKVSDLLNLLNRQFFTAAIVMRFHLLFNGRSDKIFPLITVFLISFRFQKIFIFRMKQFPLIQTVLFLLSQVIKFRCCVFPFIPIRVPN